MDVTPTYAALVSLLAHAVLVAAFLYASVVDVKTRIVPASALFAALASWATAVFSGVATGACPFLFSPASSSAASWLFESFAGGLAAGGISLASAIAIERRSGEAALGGGDVKLLFVAGLYLGPEGGLAMLAAACVLALVCQGLRAGLTAFAWAVRSRRRRREPPAEMQPKSQNVFGSAFGSEAGHPSDGVLRRPFAFVPFLTAALAAALVFLFAAAA